VRRLDFADETARAQWLAALDLAVKDLEGVTLDAIANPRRRRLGPLEHARLATEARESLHDLLAYAGATTK
jgi:hypothetical protein